MRFVSAAAGSTHTLAAGRDGLIWRWGRVPLSKSVIDRPQVHPGAPSGLGPVIEVSTRTSHCLALTAKGDVLAWGYNEFGQALPGSTDNIEVPTVVPIPTGSRAAAISQVAAGGNHSVTISFFGKIVIPPQKSNLSLHSSLSSLSGTPLSSAKSSPRGTPSPRGLAALDRSTSLAASGSSEAVLESMKQLLARDEELALLEQELLERKEAILRKERKLLKEKEDVLQKACICAVPAEFFSLTQVLLAGTDPRA